MARLFDYDNPIWRFMGKLADLFLLTILWALCSIPIITVGASTTALYYVSLKMVRNHEGYLLKSFFKSFKKNFVLSTVIWVIMAVIGMIPVMVFYKTRSMELRQASVVFWALLVMTALYLFVLTVIFPLAARLDADAGHLFLMAFVTAIRNFSWMLLMVVTTLCVTALGIFVFWPVLLLGAGGIAYAHAFILEHIIFPKYHWNEDNDKNI